MEKKVVFHVPHDGGAMPKELMRAVRVPRSVFLRWHRLMRDTGALGFVPRGEGFETIAFPVSRLLCDVERFVGADEPMEAFGMGYCYERVCDGTVVKRPGDADRALALGYYKAHHARLDAAVKGLRGRAVLVDVHSFSEAILVRELLPELRPLPDVCIGGDGAFLPREKRELALRLFQSAGLSTAYNYPYSGSMVPNAVLSGRSDAELVSVMVEVNKTVYLAPDGRPDPRATGKIRALLAELAELM
ncbi:MAG: N-formylglutamate amidohydrolase [Oscillospiraceae bacterium]|nr:N-formylglutamate amidohydrolase [Oscillospiraceae bacterium]